MNANKRKNQLCFLPDDVGWLKSCEHDISSAVLRADQSVAAEIKGQTVELESAPDGVQQIALCKCGLWCLDKAGFVHRFSNREGGQRWTRGHSWPNDSPIESICCFKDGSLCAATHDATMFVFQTNENKWLPQESLYQRAHSDPQDSVIAAANLPAKQRFRFSIRTLMLLVLAVALLLGPISYLRQCFNIRMAVNILLAQGHEIQFAHQFDANGKRIANASSPEPKWLDNSFGPRLLHRPIVFQQGGNYHNPAPVDLDSLSKMTTLQKASFLKRDDGIGLSKLANLQELTIKKGKIDDLSFIENLKRLKVLELPEDTDADLSPISRCVSLRALKVNCKDTNELQQIIAPLTNLERLDSTATALDLDWVENHLSLKSLKLTHFGAITDLSPLMQLKHLEELELPILSEDNPVPFDFALFKQAPNLTAERVTLNSANLSGMSHSSHPIVSPEALMLDLTNVDSIPKSMSIATLGIVKLNERISDLSPLKGALLNRISGPGSKVKDLEALRGMPLKSVNFNQTSVSDISLVANKRLEDLEIDDTAVSDLEPLRGIELQALTASNTPINDISMLTGTRLYSLDISGTQVHDLSAIAGAQGLHELHISNTPVSKLPSFESLRVLNMDHTSINDIQTVSEMAKLRHLSLKGTPVSDLSPTKGLKLDYIDASDTRVDRIVDFGSPNYVKLDRTKVTDLSLLADSHSLYHISVSGTPVTDLSSLTGMPNFSTLNISHTPITDLSPILKMNLRSLDLSGIKTTDFSVLSKLPELRHLKLADLPLDRIPALHPEMLLSELDLGGTQIKDLSPLFNQKYLRSLVLPKSADFSQNMIDHWPDLEKLVIGEKTILDKKPVDWRYDPWD